MLITGPCVGVAGCFSRGYYLQLILEKHMSRRNKHKKKIIPRTLPETSMPQDDKDLYLQVSQHEGEIRGLKESFVDFQRTVSKSFEASNDALVRLSSDLNNRFDNANASTGHKLDRIERRLSEESQERVRGKVIPPTLIISIILVGFAVVGGATAYVSMLVSPLRESLNKVEQRMLIVEQSTIELSVQSAEIRAKLDNQSP